MITIARVAVPLMWLAWIAYWAFAARAVKATERIEDARSRLSHRLPLTAGAVIMTIPNLLGPQLEAVRVPHDAAWQALAIAPVALGLSFSVWARVWLGRNWSSNVTVKREHELIRSGPYALVRHPIYSGLLLALAGSALMLGNGRALVGLALIAGAILRKLRIEERFMAERFGEAYARYRAQVAMLVPFLV
jgi:protein-S-isoprenylcysteine O-methyltransferase Ste14